MRERQSGGGGDNVEKNQAKRTHARCGGKQKVRERGGGEGIMEKNQAKRIHAGGGDRQKVREREEANI